MAIYGNAFNVYADTIDDPYGEASALLNIVDRPTAADSLPIPRFAVDLEVGQGISGNLFGFDHYVGTGMSIMF